MNRNKKLYTMTLTALLIAIGIVIPMVSPIKIVIPPMSFTVASHVAIILAMFISPMTAIGVSLGTTLGFFLAGFPIVVVLRALSHVIWAFIGATYLQKHPLTLKKTSSNLLFNLSIAAIHALCEVIIVIPFYTTGSISNILYMLFVLVGLGSAVHSFVDFIISAIVYKPLTKVKSVTTVANIKDLNIL